MKSVKGYVWLLIFFLTAGFQGTAAAHCGKCGMEGDHHAEEAKTGSGFEAMLKKIEARSASLDKAAEALQASNPELAGELRAYAAEDKEILQKKQEWLAAHKAEMKDASEKPAAA